jgi:hypothetical protein
VAVCIPSRTWTPRTSPRSVPQLAGAFIAAWSATVKTEVRQPMNVNERLEWIWAALGVAVFVAFAALCAGVLLRLAVAFLGRGFSLRWVGGHSGNTSRVNARLSEPNRRPRV